MVAIEEAMEATPPAEVPSRRPGEPEAIFVVGVARSGTTLMRKLLETSERIGIARENHYVGHLSERYGARFYFRRAGHLKDDEAVRRVVEMLYSGQFERKSRLRTSSMYWRWLVKHVPREDFERRLLESDRTEAGFMAAIMRLHSDLAGKPLMGEKTPAHLEYVDTLLEWFPDGRVIHTVRDPRAIYVSDRHRRETKGRKPYSWLTHLPLLLETVVLVQTVLTWRTAARLHHDYQRRYPDRYLAVRFEDVVLRPHETLPTVFNFLGVELPDFSKVYVPSAHGMRSTGEGLDPAAADRWRSRIGRFPKWFMQTTLAAPMKQFGYSD